MVTPEKAGFLLLAITKWITSTIICCMKKKYMPTHVLFCMVDHFEPGTGLVGIDVERGRMKELLSVYPKLANKHRDFHGNLPTRTWFFPPHFHRNGNLRDLVSLCEAGYGEIELHLHHGTVRPDTARNLEQTILKCIEDYSMFGIFGSTNGKKQYGFIHGDWALANSLDGRYCGVNDEIAVLKKTGCYADFTFPSPEPKASPRQINSIYYADSDPHRPKSYDKGPIVRVGGCQDQGLMIIQGPVFPFFTGNRVSSLRFAADSVTRYYPTSKTKINGWVNTGIHVSGKRNWIIVKTHTHGAVDNEQALGAEMDFILSYLEKEYNDGVNFFLHYITARELYNIIKAAEAGEVGQNPEEYRDYEVKAPKYQSAKDVLEASDALRTLLASTMT